MRPNRQLIAYIQCIAVHKGFAFLGTPPTARAEENRSVSDKVLDRAGCT